MFELESKIALESVRKVAPLLMGSPNAAGIQSKTSGKDLVTEVDLKAEQELTEILRALPHAILGEESYFQNSELKTPPYWCVDPIDGTLNFISGIPLFGTSVGLFNGNFVTGAVSLPKLGEFYYINEKAAWMNDRPLSASKCSLSSALIVDCFLGSSTISGVKTHQQDLYAELLTKSRGVLRLGSVAAGLCFLASGRVQGIIGRRCEIWDAAGGLAVANQAGYESWFQLHPDSTKLDFIAAAPGVMQSLVALVSDHQLMAP